MSSKEGSKPNRKDDAQKDVLFAEDGPMLQGEFIPKPSLMDDDEDELATEEGAKGEGYLSPVGCLANFGSVFTIQNIHDTITLGSDFFMGDNEDDEEDEDAAWKDKDSEVGENETSSAEKR